MFLEKLVSLQKNNTSHVQVASLLWFFYFIFFFWFLKNIYLFIWLCQVLIANVGSFLVVVCELLVVTCGI